METIAQFRYCLSQNVERLVIEIRNTVAKVSTLECGSMVTQAGLSYDLFICCADSDRGWTQGYLTPALGLATARVITAGQPNAPRSPSGPG